MSDPSKSPSEGHRNESVLGPFTVRDLTLFGGVLITFVGSLLPLLDRSIPANLWNASNLFFLTIGILAPVAAGALFAWRRYAPAQRLRVGSLSVDQFASVIAVLSASFYFVFTVTSLTPGAVVGLLGGLAMLAATTLARLIPPFAGDFDGRAEVPAHIVARDAATPIRRPKANAGAAQAPAAVSAEERGAGASAAGVFGAVGAGAAGAGAAAAGAAAAGAWAGHAGDGAWGAPAEEPGSERPGEAAAVPGAGAGTGGPVDPFGAPDAASGAGAGATAEPTDIGAADLLAPGPEQVAGRGDVGLEGSGRSVETPGTAALGIARSDDAAALEATEAHFAAPMDAAASAQDPAGSPGSPREAGPEEATGGAVGDADGEAYGAPEPLAGPATAIFPASSPGSSPARAQGGSGRAAGAADAEPADGIGASRSYDEQGQHEAFWFAVSQQRTAVDPSTGQPVFTLEPGQWILALQDRGGEFVVQSPDGRVGVLRELSGIERG